MLMALDLTERQAARVLAQAVRAHAKLEIDPRPESADAPIWGTLEAREQDLLVVNVVDAGPKSPLASLVGAMCDVRTVLSEQLYLFSAVILDVSEGTAPPRLSLGVPESVQVANRRRYTRKSPAEPIPVRLSAPGSANPVVGSLTNISRTGLGCRLTRKESDDLLLIGDEVQTEFVLPWVHHVYALPAIVCSKTATMDQEHVLVGFEFAPTSNAARATLELLRAVLESETERLTDMDGEL